MLRLKPTKLTFRQEDLKEYDTAKAKWVEEKAAKVEADVSDHTVAAAKDSRRSLVHQKIGLGGASK